MNTIRPGISAPVKSLLKISSLNQSRYTFTRCLYTARIQSPRASCQTRAIAKLRRNNALPATTRISTQPRWHYSTTATTSSPPPLSSTTLETPEGSSDMEAHVHTKLAQSLDPVKLTVRDVSGGCGSMFAIEVESAKFKGLNMVKQHRMVQEILADEIKGWHGVQLVTKVAR